MYQSRVHDVEKWTFGIGFKSIVDSATDRERVFKPAYGPKEVVLSSDNLLIERAVI